MECLYQIQAQARLCLSVSTSLRQAALTISIHMIHPICLLLSTAILPFEESACRCLHLQPRIFAAIRIQLSP